MHQLEKFSENLTYLIGTPKSIVVHTILFIGIFALRFFGVNTEEILLILTTAVSLEAIYLAIFIQMSVNRTTHHIANVKEDIEDIQEDVEDIQEDVEGIEEDVDDIQEDVKEISDDYVDYDADETDMVKALTDIEKRLRTLQEDISNLKTKKN